MPISNRKVVGIILDAVNDSQERCEGYHKVLQETVVDIISAERQHRVRSTNIQQQVSDICNVAGKWLAGQRPES